MNDREYTALQRKAEVERCFEHRVNTHLKKHDDDCVARHNNIIDRQNAFAKELALVLERINKGGQP